MTQLINKISLLTSHTLDFWTLFILVDAINKLQSRSSLTSIDINYLHMLTPPTTQAGSRNIVTMVTNNQLYSGLTVNCKQNACLWRSLKR